MLLLFLNRSINACFYIVCEKRPSVHPNHERFIAIHYNTSWSISDNQSSDNYNIFFYMYITNHNKQGCRK